MTESTSEYKKRIEEIKQSIENEPYMAKMREDIAEGISKTGIRQAAVEEKFQAVIDETTGKDVISAPEIIVGRGGYATLGERLDEDKAEVSAQLAQKTNKGNVSVFDINKNLGKLDQTFMSEEFIRQFVDNTQPINAVPALKSITQEKMAFTVLPGIESKNLFDKRTITPQTYINSITGTPTSNSGFFSSDYIYVDEAQQYTISPRDAYTRIVLFSENKTYHSAIADGLATFVVPSGVRFIKFSNPTLFIDTTQVEKGETPTNYEKYAINLDPSTVKKFSLSPDVFKPRAITSEFLAFNPVTVEIGKNIHNGNGNITNGLLNFYDGSVLDFEGYYISDYMSVKPEMSYCLSGTTNAYRRIGFYDEKKLFISGVEKTDVFTTPENAFYIRFSSDKKDLSSVQIEVGTVATDYEDYKIKITPDITEAFRELPKKIYTFNDAWANWMVGEKFPVAFYGDSTVDGVGTTGYLGNSLGEDSSSINSFPVKLQGTLRESTGNSTLRIYNAGFSGRDAVWGLENIATEFSGASVYKDVKMLGIGFGINDRLKYKNVKAYREGFKENIVGMINWCYENNIQPFLLTTQAIVSPGVSEEFAADFPLRDAKSIESVANEAKKEIAREYDLELLDINKSTESFLVYSSHSTKNIVADKLHFGDIGHKYESDFVFSVIEPRVIKVNTPTQIDYSNQKLVSGVPENWVSLPDVITDGFKCYVNRTKSDTNDLKIMTVYIFNDSRKKLKLQAYKHESADTYIKLNGVIKTLTGSETTLGDLELGLHKLEVFTGISTSIDFKGFKLT